MVQNLTVNKITDSFQPISVLKYHNKITVLSIFNKITKYILNKLSGNPLLKAFMYNAL